MRYWGLSGKVWQRKGMATKLHKTVRRESQAQVFDRGMRNIIISLEPPGLLGFRAKGTRTTYWTTVEACYHLAVKAHVEAQRKEKRLNRKKIKLVFFNIL